MRNIILMLIALFIISCSNNSPISKETTVDFNSKEYSSAKFIEEKFKEFYDLNTLLIKYPSFKEDIEKRIQNFTLDYKLNFDLIDSLIGNHYTFLSFYETSGLKKRDQIFTLDSKQIFKLNDSLEVKNIKQRGSIIFVSDSVQMTKVYFDLVYKDSVKKDSVFAFITSKKIMIDSKEVLSSKVKFSKTNIQ